MPDKISREQVIHVAGLARLSLTDEEINLYSLQLAAILSHADEISALDLSDTPPTSHSLPIENVYRDDIVQECLGQANALAAAPLVESGRFKVPRILEES